MIISRTRPAASAARVEPDAEPARLQKLSAARHRQPQDTGAGCRAFAAADLARADDEAQPWPRARMEHSAAAWTARADLLERLEAGTGIARRKKLEAAALGEGA